MSRWREDLSLLLQVFPRALLEVHVSEEYVSETSRLESPRIEVRTVLGRKRAWLARLFRTAVAHPRPTILITGEGLRALAPAARLLFPLSDPLPATRMNDLVLALRAVNPSRHAGS
ncbi:MAG: hypothetical protein ACR2G6_17795 [Gemmatimonadaceae bacterium]